MHAGMGYSYADCALNLFLKQVLNTTPVQNVSVNLKPRRYLGLNIASFFCCCCYVGLIGLIYGFQVMYTFLKCNTTVGYYYYNPNLGVENVQICI